MNNNVLIICSFFEYERKYMEVQCANVLHKMGYNVCVLTSDMPPRQKTSRISEASPSYEVIRVRRMLRIKDTLFPLENLRNEVRAVNPKLAFLIGPNHGLPYFLMKYLPRSCRVISMFGDLTGSRKRGFLKGSPFIRWLIKNRWYHKLFDQSDVIASNTPETSKILTAIARNNIQSRLIMTGLGYEQDVFYYDPAIRSRYRARCGVSPDEKLLVSATRIVKHKPVLQWIQPVVQAMRSNGKLRYMIVGFPVSDYARQVKKEILSLDIANQFILLDYAESDELNRLYNCADFSIWFIPTISIQQAMGTGLPIIIPDDMSLQHLAEDNVNGFVYRNPKELHDVIGTIADWKYDRKRTSILNEKYSYERILESVLRKVGC